MLVEMKPIRHRVFDLLNQSNGIAAMYMVGGKEPTGNIREDLKHVRAINYVDIATGTTGITAGNQTLSHRAVVSGYSGYGAKFYQDGSQNDALYVQAFPVSVYPQDFNQSYDATMLFSAIRNYSGYYPQNPFEAAILASYNASNGDSPGPMIADYGTVFDFRKMSCLAFAATTLSNYKIEYSVDGVTWTALTVPAIRTAYFNFSARYLRYTSTSAGQIAHAFVWQVVPKDNAFVAETVDKIVLCRSVGIMMGTNVAGAYNPLNQNYIGITLDIGTDVLVSDTVTGTARVPNFRSCRIGFDSNVVEAS